MLLVVLSYINIFQLVSEEACQNQTIKFCNPQPNNESRENSS